MVKKTPEQLGKSLIYVGCLGEDNMTKLLLTLLTLQQMATLFHKRNYK